VIVERGHINSSTVESGFNSFAYKQMMAARATHMLRHLTVGKKTRLGSGGRAGLPELSPWACRKGAAWTGLRTAAIFGFAHFFSMESVARGKGK
jgi:hypothetical protein